MVADYGSQYFESAADLNGKFAASQAPWPKASRKGSAHKFVDFSQTDKVKCATKSSYASRMQAVSCKFDKKLNVPCSIESLKRKLDDVPVISSLVSQRAQRKSRDLFFNSEMEKRVQKRRVLKS